MNGVARFLSRRDKHHNEKRSLKHPLGKVCPYSSSSSHSSHYLLCSQDSGLRDSKSHSPREPSCLQQLSLALRTVVGGSTQFISTACSFKSITPCFPPVPTSSSSDLLSSQSRHSQSSVSPEIYKVFTNDELKPTDKDAEKKKVRTTAVKDDTKIQSVDADGYRHSFNAYRQLASPNSGMNRSSMPWLGPRTTLTKLTTCLSSQTSPLRAN